jgi:hypothetical protein
MRPQCASQRFLYQLIFSRGVQRIDWRVPPPRVDKEILMNKFGRTTLGAALILVAMLSLSWVAYAAIGTLLGTVALPGNYCSVAGTFDGTYYITLEGKKGATGKACSGNVIQIYTPPAGGDGTATLVASKQVIDGDGNPANLSAIAWDSKRDKLWGAYSVVEEGLWLIDLGDPSVSGTALAEFQFNPNVGGDPHIDGLAYDPIDDTLYHSPDIDCNVYHFSLGTDGNPLGTLLNTVSPRNAEGDEDCFVSGVAVGSDLPDGRGTLYIARNGFAEIRLIDKTTGEFISTFATTAGRVEDLTCDSETYEAAAILAKDAFEGLYEAFQVESGSCPLVGNVEKPLVTIDIKPGSFPNSINMRRERGTIPVAILSTEGFYAPDEVDRESLTFGRTGDELSLRKCPKRNEDANGDGVLDVVCHFYRKDTGFVLGDEVGILKGMTKDGQLFQGEDSVRILYKTNKK